MLRHAVGDGIRWVWGTAFRWGAIVSDTRAARRFGSFGEGSYIAFPQAVIMGEKYMHLGADVRIGPYVALSTGIGPGQVPVLERTLVIGDHTVIGRGSAIAAHFSVEIGSNVWLAPECFVCDQGHDWTDLDLPIGMQLGEAQATRIGDNSWLGHGVIVLPGVTIGEHVAVGAGSVVTEDLPDRCVAVGSPARPVREHDPEHGWVRAAAVRSRAAGETSGATAGEASGGVVGRIAGGTEGDLPGGSAGGTSRETS